MLNNNKRVSIERKSLDAAILRNKSSDDSINSSKGATSPVNTRLSSSSNKKKHILLFNEDSNDSDFEYY
jgi:hypothetical protein